MIIPSGLALQREKIIQLCLDLQCGKVLRHEQLRRVGTGQNRRLIMERMRLSGIGAAHIIRFLLLKHALLVGASSLCESPDRKIPRDLASGTRRNVEHGVVLI